jgi:hypothetical protein
MLVLQALWNPGKTSRHNSLNGSFTPFFSSFKIRVKVNYIFLTFGWSFRKRCLFILFRMTLSLIRVINHRKGKIGSKGKIKPLFKKELIVSLWVNESYAINILPLIFSKKRKCSYFDNFNKIAQFRKFMKQRTVSCNWLIDWFVDRPFDIILQWCNPVIGLTNHGIERKTFLLWSDYSTYMYHSPNLTSRKDIRYWHNCLCQHQ